MANHDPIVYGLNTGYKLLFIGLAAFSFLPALLRPFLYLVPFFVYIPLIFVGLIFLYGAFTSAVELSKHNFRIVFFSFMNVKHVYTWSYITDMKIDGNKVSITSSNNFPSGSFNLSFFEEPKEILSDFDKFIRASKANVLELDKGIGDPDLVAIYKYNYKNERKKGLDTSGKGSAAYKQMKREMEAAYEKRKKEIDKDPLAAAKKMNSNVQILHVSEQNPNEPPSGQHLVLSPQMTHEDVHKIISGDLGMGEYEVNQLDNGNKIYTWTKGELTAKLLINPASKPKLKVLTISGDAYPYPPEKKIVADQLDWLNTYDVLNLTKSNKTQEILRGVLATEYYAYVGDQMRLTELKRHSNEKIRKEADRVYRKKIYQQEMANRSRKKQKKKKK